MSSKYWQPLDRNINKLRGETNLTSYAYLFVEIVKYSEENASSVDEIQAKLASFGNHVGLRLIDLVFLRDKQYKRETKLKSILLYIKGPFWKSIYSKEIEDLERAVDNDNTYYLMEREPVVNKYISFPKDKGNLNCAAFNGGIIESVLTACGFDCKVTTVWYKGTAYIIKFEDHVVVRDKHIDGR